MKILVIQQKMIGDVLTSSILFEALRQKYPEAELHYLIQPHTRPVVQNNPYIDKLVIYDPALNKNPVKFLFFGKQIRREGYTHVIDIYSKISTGIISLVSGASCRLGYHKKYTSYFYTKTFTPVKEPATIAGLAIEDRMQFLQGLQKDFPKHSRPKIYLDNLQKQKAAINLKAGGISFEKPLIMCGVLGSSKYKSYPSSYMAALLDKVVAQVGNGQILFNYSPCQEKEALEIYNLCNPVTRSRIFIELYARELQDFIANCAICDLFIGNEGGAANIAKALKIPSFSIHSPSVQKNYWGIYEDGDRNVSVHLKDFRKEALAGLSSTEITKNAAGFYELLEPNLIFAKLNPFLQKVTLKKSEEK